MTSESLKAYTNYWKCSLADGEIGRGTFTSAQAKALNARGINLSDVKSGHLFSDVNIGWLESEGNQGQDQSLTVEDLKRWAVEGEGAWVKCVIYPYAYLLQTKHQHGWKSRRYVPEMVAPCSITVLVNAEGKVLPYGRPTIARELLDPAYAGQALVIGAVDDMDTFFNENPFPDYLDEESPSEEGRWSMEQVLEYNDNLLDAVCQKELTHPLDDEDAEYVLVHQGLIHPTDAVEGAIRPLVDVYDAVKVLNPTVPLAETLVAGKAKNIEKNGITASMSRRCGAMEGAFPLGDDQRLALSLAMQLKEGEVLAVNGPPGTGKTTLLKDLVASRLVRAALEGRDPDILVISSTNNQAVTNVLDTFTGGTAGHDGPLEQRWVAGWDSFGVYLASKARRATARSQGYYTDEDLKVFEDAAVLDEQQNYFLEQFEQWKGAPAKTFQEGVAELHNRLRLEWRALKACLSLPGTYQSAIKAGTPQDCLKAIRDINRTLTKVGHPGTGISESLNQVAGWAKSVQRLQAQRKQEIAKEQKTLDAINRFEASLTPFWRRVAKWPLFRDMVDRRRTEALLADGVSADLPVDAIRKHVYQQKRRIQRQYAEAIRDVADTKTWSSWLAQLDDHLDTVWRPRLFWMAVHYFEARWITEMKETVRNGDPDRRSRVKMERRWRRWAKLAPAMISTLHSLPRQMNYWDHGRQEELPAFGMIDWLVLDEAGQVSPEVAGAGILLSKRLVGVGDKYQIEPVWNITRQVDMGNLISNKLLPNTGDLESVMEAMDQTGRLASSGSAIVMAQQATATHSSKGLPGVTLINHRRCLPEIVGYCNELCYEGALIPRREPKGDEGNAAQFQLMHVPGVAERAGGSRINVLEGAAIASWIADNAERLKSRYAGRSLADIVAVVTPFRAQARVITTRLQQLMRDDAAGLVVGTVHSLQGAERPVIVFSPTYSTHRAQGLFFDKGPNMLNVAVSRAKDQFIVVGDLDVLQNGQHPSRLLFSRLDQYGAPLPFPIHGEVVENAIVHTWGDAPSKRLVDREAHNAWLQEILKNTGINKMTIVSPLLSINSLRRFGEGLARMAMNGTQVDVVISRSLNTGGDRHGLFRNAVETLGRNRVIVRQADHVTSSAVFIDNDAMCIGSGSLLGEPGEEETADQLAWSDPLQSLMLQHDYVRKEHQRQMIALGLEARGR